MAGILFGSDMVLDPKVVQEVCARALMKARTMGSLRIFVNPRDAVQLDADWRDFQVSISGQRIQIVPTDSIHPGGCFIEGDHGAVDARLETRLGAVMKVFETQTEE
jgi:flagellar biosynthesis/type III secretory pathway protein FliH